MIPKFRAWDKQLKILRPVATIDFAAKEVSHWFDEDGETYCHFAECILMQSTGLKDKNGVEIFDGDIVKYRDWGKEYNLEVVWLPEKARFGLKTKGGHINLKLWSDNYYEVLGNIYENPELVEGEDG